MTDLTATPTESTAAPLVLVVDDVPKNVQLLGKVLSEEGFRVAVAMDGKQALHSIERNTPDLILLDVMMPEMDGYEVCKALQENDQLSDIPVIFLTARNGTEDVVAGFDAGAVDFVTKPFQTREVLARVKTQLQLKHARDTIQRFNNELQEMLEARTRHLLQSERQAAFGQMVQGIVHNLRNPLAASMLGAGTIELALAKCNNADGSQAPDVNALLNLERVVRRTVQVINESNRKLDAMMNSLLAKGRSDKISTIKSVDLNEILRLEVDFLGADMRFKHDVKQEIRWSADPVFIDVAPGEIAQVFQNILRNALDALWNHPKPDITITTARRGDKAVFSVSDNGPGIPSDVLEKVFDPFFTTKLAREDKQDNSNEPLGTGLGLWMCRETVNSYNGKIRIETAAGKGTTFEVSLPLHSDPAGDPPGA